MRHEAEPVKAEREARRAATEPPTWGVHHPSHMKGWEAFGITGASPPTVRQLGVGWDGKGKPGTEKWAFGEVAGGVAAIEVHTFADHPGGAYVYVVGTDEDAVARRWQTVASVYQQIGDVLWP